MSKQSANSSMSKAPPKTLEKLKNDLAELYRFKEMLDKKSVSLDAENELIEQQLETATQENALEKQRIARLNEMVRIARLKSETAEKESEEAVKCAEAMKMKLENLECEKAKIMEEKQTVLMDANIEINELASKVINLNAFYDAKKCEEETPRLIEYVENLKRKIAQLDADIEKLQIKGKANADKLTLEKARTECLPKISVRKFLLREAREERRELALKLFQTNMNLKKRENESSASRKRKGPDSINSFDPR